LAQASDRCAHGAMAAGAADLRRAPVTVLKEWCHDFGIEPRGKKEDIIKQLCISMRAASIEANPENPAGDESSVAIATPREAEEPPLPETFVRRRCRVKTNECHMGLNVSEGLAKEKKLAEGGGLQRWSQFNRQEYDVATTTTEIRSLEKQCPDCFFPLKASPPTVVQDGRKSKKRKVDRTCVAKKRMSCETLGRLELPEMLPSIAFDDTSVLRIDEGHQGLSYTPTAKMDDDVGFAVEVSPATFDVSSPTAGQMNADDCLIHNCPAPGRAKKGGAKGRRWEQLPPVASTPTPLSPLIGGVEQWAALCAEKHRVLNEDVSLSTSGHMSALDCLIHNCSTPGRAKKVGAKGRRWRQLSPAAPTPTPLSPLLGGVQHWAALYAEKQRVVNEDADSLRSKSECIGHTVPSTFPVTPDKGSTSPMGGKEASVRKDVFDYGRLEASNTARALVALSVAAAEQDETIVEPRLVDLCTGMVHLLPRDGVIAIGRGVDCDIVVAFPVVDVRHCVLVCKESQVEVEDVGSNGTYLNDLLVPKGELLPQRIPLRRGDALALSHPDGPKFLFLCGCGPLASSLGGA